MDKQKDNIAPLNVFISYTEEDKAFYVELIEETLQE